MKQWPEEAGATAAGPAGGIQSGLGNFTFCITCARGPGCTRGADEDRQRTYSQPL